MLIHYPENDGRVYRACTSCNGTDTAQSKQSTSLVFSHRNWVTLTLTRNIVMLPPFGSKWETLACGGEGMGDSIPTMGQTLWYSRYTIIPQCLYTVNSNILGRVSTNVAVYTQCTALLHICSTSCYKRDSHTGVRDVVYLGLTNSAHIRGGGRWFAGSQPGLSQ